MLQIRNLRKSFGDLQVLKSIDLDVNRGDVVAILGPSGSGKTTMLRCLNFLEKSDGGTMLFDDQRVDLARVTHAEANALRRRTGFVFQSYNLFANKTALQNVTFGLFFARKMPRRRAEEIARAALVKVGMDDRADYYPSQLSGGQQQRVAIARAMAADPEIIYFDEPTSALDPELTGEVLAVMRSLAGEGRTMLVVTHEMDFARHAANRVVFMEQGVIVEQNTAEAFFNDPQQPRTKEFLQTYCNEEPDQTDRPGPDRRAGPDRLRQQRRRHRARSGIRRREHRRGRVRRPVERDPGQGYHHGCDGGHMGTLDLPR